MKNSKNPGQEGHDGAQNDRDLESILLPGDTTPPDGDKLDLDTFMESIKQSQLIDLSDLSDDDLPPFFKATSAFKSVLLTIDRARQLEAALALITGAHGAGKTTAVRIYGRKEPINYWQCGPSYHAKHLLRDVGKALGITMGDGWQAQTSIVRDQLVSAPRTFVLDEAQRLSYEGCDLLKYLADESGSTFVLIASPSLEKRIDRWPDISTRCTVRTRVSSIDIGEFTALYAKDGYSAEALAELHRLSGGVMRTINALVRQIDLEIEFHNTRTQRQLTRRDLTVKHVRRMAEKITG